MKAVSQQNKDRWQWINCSIGGEKQTLLISDQIPSPQFQATQCSHRAPHELRWVWGRVFAAQRVCVVIAIQENTASIHYLWVVQTRGRRQRGKDRWEDIDKAFPQAIIFSLSLGYFFRWPYFQIFFSVTPLPYLLEHIIQFVVTLVSSP